ncbi:aminotransferase class V-fold PLP-dependent enzyme [Candidatus Saccharibacteria bacterium]|nr:aminotransferase class V-fold PLP-dependent enzyme [Candidatus Saccharibacteria bacterium]
MIYLDHAAATPLLPAVRIAMEPYLSDQFFNPSALYLPAIRVREAYENARQELAMALGAKSAEITLTAGATESIHLAFQPFKNVIISDMEHPAVRAAAAARPNSRIVRRGYITEAIKPDTELISVALADSIFGSIAPIAKIAAAVKTERANRKKSGNNTPIYLHTDASQAPNLINLNVARLGIDLMTISASKIGGPKQVGLLYAKAGVELTPLISGGGQENGLRSGTENVAGVIGFATALKHAQGHAHANQKHYNKLTDEFYKHFHRDFNLLDEYCILATRTGKTLANFITIIAPGIDAERLVYLLETKGVYVATGSACSAKNHEENPTLKAYGYRPEWIFGYLRITLGSTNTLDQMQPAAEAILDAIRTESKRIPADTLKFIQQETKRLAIV